MGLTADFAGGSCTRITELIAIYYNMCIQMFSCTSTVFCKRGLIGHHSPTEIYFTFILMFENIKILTILKTFTVFSQKGWMAPGIIDC